MKKLMSSILNVNQSGSRTMDDSHVGEVKSISCADDKSIHI